ncbi:MAG TPA: hypothetical protein VKC53_00590 [Patescibacteria group bacterium]|nr:hypothetical protein [Patescibacteria group bacterium]
MKQNKNPPSDFNFQKTTELIEALQIMLPKKLGLSDVLAKKTLKTDYFSWKNPEQLEKYTLEVTGEDNIKYAERRLVQWQEELAETSAKIVEPPKTVVEASLPNKGLREQQQADVERAEAQTIEREERIGVKLQAELDAKVKAAANAKIIREFKESVKNKNVYAKVKEANESLLSQDDEVKINNLKSEAKIDPDGLTAQVAADIKSRLEQVGVQGDIDGASELTAQNMVAVLGGNSPLIEAVIAKQSVDKGMLGAAGEFGAAQNIVKDYSQYQVESFMFSKNIAEVAFGKDGKGITDRIFSTPESIQVANIPTEGFTPYAVSKLINSEPTVIVNTSDLGTGSSQPIFINRVSRPHFEASSRQTDRFDFRSQMSSFKPSPSTKSVNINAQKIGTPKISISTAPLRQAASGITKVFADLFSKGKIAIKGLENSQGGLIVGGIAVAVAGITSGSALLTSVGFGSTAAGFVVNPGRALSGSAFGNVVAPILGFFHSVMNFVLEGIVLPIILAVLCVPLLIALFLFIINSGALIVPPGQSTLSSTNPYIEVRKVPNPGGQLGSPQAITYTITVTAKKDLLTRISFKTDCKAIKKSGPSIDCSSLEKIATSTASIAPGSPFSFNFTSNYDAKYQDSLVSDTITVSAESNEGGKLSETGSASVCFGKCPLNCFDFSSPTWSSVPNLQSNLTQAAAQLASQYPNFAAKVCGGGTVKLCYTTSNPTPVGKAGICNQATYAKDVEQKDCNINFNQCGIKSTSDALFILTHETTHHIQIINKGSERLFEQNVPQSEWPICTYGLTGSNPYESQAEGDALFVNQHPSWASSCVTNYAVQYPKHYNFAKNVMFGP